MDTRRLISDLQFGDDADLQRRRGIIGVSLLGMASMACSMMFQTGMIKHLPDPPLPGFDSDKVNSSHLAYRLGVPDGPLAVLAFAANLPLAAAAGSDRASTHPWLPLLAAGKALGDALAALWYFSQMPLKERAWCGYCIAATAADVAVLALSLPEARKGLQAALRPFF